MVQSPPLSDTGIEVKQGDRVRVVLEGDVDAVDQDGDFFFLGNSRCKNAIFYSADHLVSVEVLVPPAKVGDVLTTVEELDALPPYSIVKGADPGGLPAIKTYAGWEMPACANDGDHGVAAQWVANWPAEVIFIPGDDES